MCGDSLMMEEIRALPKYPGVFPGGTQGWQLPTFTHA